MMSIPTLLSDSLTSHPHGKDGQAPRGSAWSILARHHHRICHEPGGSLAATVPPADFPRSTVMSSLSRGIGRPRWASLQRVLCVRVGSATGSAFVVEHDQKQYIVTARPVVAAVDDTIGPSEILVRRKRRWMTVPVAVVALGEGETGVAVLAPVRRSRQQPPQHDLGRGGPAMPAVLRADGPVDARGRDPADAEPGAVPRLLDGVLAAPADEAVGQRRVGPADEGEVLQASSGSREAQPG